MTDYIGGDPPVTKLISLTRGADKVITMRRKDTTGNPLDWNATVYMVVDTTDPVTAAVEQVQYDATVTADVAVIRLESTVGDELTVQKWRIIMSQAGSPSLETPLLRGKFQRND